MKSNRQFRQQADEKVTDSIGRKLLDNFIYYNYQSVHNPTIGTFYSPSIKQTRIINRLKELLK